MPVKPSYKEAIKYLHNLEIHGINLGLQRITAILKSLGNPHDKLNIIHVGGTNGKGSTSAMIAAVLQKAGYKVGLYTSPHLIKFNERIRINSREIPDRKIAELAGRIKSISDFGFRISDFKISNLKSQITNHKCAPTFFEFTTAMAFLYFAEEKVDIAVIEVGLGGRLDATNEGNPLVSIITNVAKDHQATLGNSIREIASEKAGIIKKGGILISAETKPAALKVLTTECNRKRAVFYRLDRDFFMDEKKRKNGEIYFPIPRFPDSFMSHSSPFTFTGRRWLLKDLRTNLLGRHQRLNAACTLAVLEVLEETCPRMFLSGKGFRISESAVRNGLQNVSWPGRLEILSERPLIVLDCAHNPAGADVLRDALLDLRFAIDDLRMKNKNNNSKIENRKSKIILVIGIMADKDIKGILSRLAPIADMIMLTRPKLERAASVDMLYKKVAPYADRIELLENVHDACSLALSLADAGDMLCITGSVFTVGEARDFFIRYRNEEQKK